MRVLNLGTSDTGGNGIRTKHAFDRHAPGWTYNTTYRREFYFGYSTDQPWRQAPELAAKADVLHFQNSTRYADELGAQGRPMVVHHHGTKFRNNSDALLAQQRDANAVGVVATLDLWLMAPDDTEWLPSPYDLDRLDELGGRTQTEGPGRPYRIAHAPTNREIKSTVPFLRAVKKLAHEMPVELVLIERKPWAHCLALKASCDIYFDQVQLGYGNNAIEAWGMGKPVIAGAQPDTLAEMNHRFGSLPFYVADEGNIYDALLALADPDTRTHWGRRGLEHVRQWHDDKRIVQQLQAIYERAAS